MVEAGNLLEVVALASKDPDFLPGGVDTTRLKPRTKMALLGAREKQLPQDTKEKLLAAITRQTLPPDHPDNVYLDLEAELFASGDPDYFEQLALKTDPKSLSDVDYDQAARIVLGLSRATPTQVRVGSTAQGLEMEDMGRLLAQLGGSEEEVRKQVGLGEMINYQDPKYLEDMSKRGLRSWHMMVDEFPHIGLPDYHGMSNLDLDKPTPELVRLVRQIRYSQYVVSALNRRGLPLQDRARYAAAAYPSQGADQPDLFGELPKAIPGVQQYFEIINKGTEKIGPELVRATPKEFEVQAVLSAFHRPFVVRAPDVVTGEERKASFMFGAGEILSMFEGGDRYEVERSENGYTYFYDGNGNKTTMEYMSPEERRRVLEDDTIRFSYKKGKDPFVFGRKVPGEQHQTKTVLDQVDSGLSPVVDWMTRQLREQGVNPNLIHWANEYHMDGEELSADHPLIQQYVAENGPESQGGRIILEASVTNAQYLLSAIALAELMHRNWTWDAARLKNHTPEIIDKGARKWTYDEYYANNPNVFRPDVQTFLNPWTSWKRANVVWLDIAMRGNPDLLTLPSRNPIRLGDAPTIPPVTLADGTPLHALKKTDKKKWQLLTNIIDGLRYQRSQWRTKTFPNMEGPNKIVVAASKGATLEECRARGRVFFDRYLDTYHQLAPQELPSSPGERMIRAEALLSRKRAVFAEVNWRPQVEMLGGGEEGLPDEEFMGVFGWQRINERDSPRHIVVAGLEHLFKYTGVYTEMANAKAKALGLLFWSLNNGIDPRLENLMGEMPDQLQALKPDESIMALMKVAINLWWSMKEARTAKEAINVADEFVKIFVEELYPTNGWIGKSLYDDLEDVILSSFQKREKVVDMVMLRIGGTGLGVHGDPTDTLVLGKEMTVEQMRNAQVGLESGGYSVAFHNNADPSDYVNRFVDSGVLPEGIRLVEGDSQQESTNKLEQARRLLRERGFDWVDPYVRWGLQVQKALTMDDNNLFPPAVRTRLSVLGEYGHRGGTVAWLDRVLNVCKDRGVMPEFLETRILKKAGVNREDLDRARNIKAEELEKAYNEVMETLESKLRGGVGS